MIRHLGRKEVKKKKGLANQHVHSCIYSPLLLTMHVWLHPILMLKYFHQACDGTAVVGLFGDES